MKLKKKNIFIGIILLILVSITVGYAYLSQKLDIKGNTKIKENSWIIYFEDIVEREDNNVIPTDHATITNFEKTQIDFSVTLSEPGDKYEFIVDIKNDGTIDAVIDEVTKSELDPEIAKYLDFDVTYLDGTPLQRCDLLKAQSFRKAKAVVKFKKDITAEDLPEDAITLNLFFSIHYVQSAVCEIPNEPSDQYTLYIDPNEGEYEPRSDEIFNEETGLYEKILSVGEEFTLGTASKDKYTFIKWQAINNDGYTTHLNTATNTVTMDENDAYVKATYQIEEDYVARIEQVYYKTIQLAFDDAEDGDMIYLLKNTEESPTNYKNLDITLNLDGYKVKGTLTNTGRLRLVNLCVAEGECDGYPEPVEGEVLNEVGRTNKRGESYFYNPEGYGAVNTGTFILGYDDGVVEQDGIALIGKETLGGIGLKQSGTFDFYDGYLEGYIALDGIYRSIPVERYVFIDHNDIRNCQKGYLIERPDRAIAKSVHEGCTIFYFNLQDALISSMEQGYDIYAIRDFEGAYPLEIYENKEALFDIAGFVIETGYTITNNGTFTLRDSATRKGEFLPSVSMVNNGTLNIETIEISGTTDRDVIQNKGNLNLVETRINAKDAYAINIMSGTSLIMDNNTYLTSEQFALYCSSTNPFTIKGGHIGGVRNQGNLVVESGTDIDIITFGDDSYGIKNDSSNAKVVLNNVDFDITSNGVNVFATYNAYDNAEVIVNGGNYIIESTNSDSRLNAASGSNVFYGGKVVVNDGTIKTINKHGAAKIFYRVPGITINGGEFITEGKDVAIISSSNATITSGTFNATGDETAYISYNYDYSGRTFKTSGNPTLNSNHVCIVAYDGTTTIDGGTFNCESYFLEGSSYSTYAWTNARNFGTVNINGGNIRAGNHGIYGRGHLNMTGGTLTSTKNGYEMYGDTIAYGNVYMTGGKIQSLTGYGLHIEKDDSKIVLGGNTNSDISPTIIGYISGIYVEKASVTIKDGYVLGETQYGIHTSGPTNIGIEDKNVHLDSPEIRGYYYGVYIKNDVDVNFYDGILKGITHGYNGIITGVEDATQIYEEGEDEFNGETYNNCYLIEQEEYVRVGDVKFNSLQKAIDYIDESGTIVVIKDHDIKNTMSLPEGKDIILDFDGHNLTLTKTFTNNGTFTLMTSIENETAGFSSNVSKPITNNGTLTVESGTYSTAQGMMIYNKKLLTVNGGIIETVGSYDSLYAIYNEETYKIGNQNYPVTVTVNGGVISTTSKYESDTKDEFKATTIYGGKVIVEDGTIESTSMNATVINASNVIVNGGELTATGTSNAYDFFGKKDAIIETNNNPIIKSSHMCSYLGDSTLTVNGGTFTCGTDFVSGQYFTGGSSSFGTVNINGGEATTGRYGIYGYGKINMTSGIITSTQNNIELPQEIYGNKQDKSNKWLSIVNMTGGKIISKAGYGIYTFDENIINIGMLEDTTYIEDKDEYEGEIAYVEGSSIGIYLNAGTLNVNIAEILGRTQYGVYSNGTSTFGIDEEDIETLSQQLPSVRGFEYGVYINEGTTTNINDGIYKGTKYGYNGFISGFPDTVTITEGEETINSVHFITNYLIVQEYFLRVDEEYFNSLQQAIDYIDESNTIYVIADHNIKTDTELPNGKDIVLEFDGHSLIFSKVLTNNGKLTLEDNGTNENKSGGIAVSPLNPIAHPLYNKGTMIINGGNYHGLAEMVILNEGDLEFNDGLIYNKASSESTYGIFSDIADKDKLPSVTMTGGTIRVDGTGKYVYGIYNNEEINKNVKEENQVHVSTTIEDGTINVTSNYDGHEYNYLFKEYGANGIYGGIVTINDGHIISNNEVGSSKDIISATVEMNGGTLDSNGLFTANLVSSNFTMNHGVINSNGTDTSFGVYNFVATNKEVNIDNDSEINSKQVCLNVNGGSTTITNGTLNCGTLGIYGAGGSYTSSPSAVSNVNFGHVTILDGVINAGTVGVQGYGTLDMEGGKIYSTNNGINLNTENNTSTVTMTGGTIESSSGYGIYAINASSVITIGSELDSKKEDKPYIYGPNNGVYLEKGSVYLGYRDGSVDLFSLNIVGGNYGVYNAPDKPGKVYFYDGILKGFAYGYEGEITEIESGTYIFEDQEIIGDLEYTINYLVSDGNIVRNVNTGELYNNLELAFTESNPNDKLELITHAQIYYTVDIPDTVLVEFDLKGYTLATTREITNNGTITMYDSSEAKTGLVSTSLGINLLINNGTMNITEIPFSNPTKRTERVIYNNGTLTLDKVVINSYNNIENNDGTLTLTDCTLISGNTAITDNGVVNMTGGSITSGGYGIYSTANGDKTSTYENISVESSSAAIYKYSGSSTMNVSDSDLSSGYIQNMRGTLNISNGKVNDYIKNAATLNIDNSEIIDSCFVENSNSGYNYVSMSNSGTMTFDNVTYSVQSGNNGDFTMLENNGTFNSYESTYDVNRSYGKETCWGFPPNYQCRDTYVYGINGNGSINTSNSTYNILDTSKTTMSNNHVNYYGFKVGGNGKVTTNGDEITFNKGLSIYGIYSTTSNKDNRMLDTTITAANAKTQFDFYLENGTYLTNNNTYTAENGNTIYGIYVKSGYYTMETGSIDVSSEETAYGVYIDTFDANLTMGIKDGDGTKSPNVHQDNPSVKAIGDRTGIGLKKENGFFRFYDGIIIGNTAAKPDTTSDIEYNYEALNFYDDIKDYVFCTLEYMIESQTSLEDYVVVIGNTYFRTLNAAFAHAENGDVARIIKQVEQDGVNYNGSITLNLNGHTLGGTITNYGTLTIYGGQINGLTVDGKNNSAIINSGTLYLGKNDNEIDHDEIVILSDGTTLVNTGDVIMYDGTIRGKIALDGRAIIPPYYAVVVESITQDNYENIQLDYADFTTGAVYEYDYTGREDIFVAPVDGYYELQTWGAQGGSYNENYAGGYGAYAKGVVYLHAGDILYINVGGHGYIVNNGEAPGGYNGGGNVSTNASVTAGSGGGATHIATQSGLLSTFNHKEDIVLIAAAGGGGAYIGTDNASRGGDGKGLGENQSETFGIGANGTNAAGGGAGYYGGTNGQGGSSTIKNEKLEPYNGITKVMYAYKGLESKDPDTKTVSTTSASEIPTGGYAKKGNGYAKITILSSEKDEETYQVVVNPTKGFYNGTKDPTIYFLKTGESITLGEITDDSFFIFNHFEANVEGVYDASTNTVTMGDENIIITAIWDVDTNIVKARIDDEYYKTLGEAFEAIDSDNTIYLLADVTENITNDKDLNIKLDLGGFTVHGSITNNGNINLVNGTIENESGTAFINNGTLDLGEDDKEIDTESVAIIGTTIGLKQNGTFNFYDGFLEGEIALDGLFNIIPKGYLIFSDRNFIKDCQRIYLMLIPDSNQPDLAVARVTHNYMDMYFYNLQDAFNMASASGLTVYAIRDFDAPYELSIRENGIAKFDLNGYNIKAGTTVTNNGIFTILDSSETKGSLKTYLSIVNNGSMIFQDIDLEALTEVNVIDNYGNINVYNSTLRTKSGSSNYVIYNHDAGTIMSDENSYLNATDYSIYNAATQDEGLILEGGNLVGIYNIGKLTINDGTKIVKETSERYKKGIYNDTDNARLTMNGGSISVSGIGAYGIYNNSKLVEFTMNGGTINVTNTSSLESAYGIFNTTNGSWQIPTSTILINGGEIKVSSSGYSHGIMYGNITMNSGTIDVEGGREGISNTNAIYLNNAKDLFTMNSNKNKENNPLIKSNYICIYVGQGTAVINDGNLECTNDAIYNNGSSANTTITGGRIISKQGNAIYINYGTLNINSDSMPEGEYTYIEGYTNGIYTYNNNNRDIIVYIKDSEIVGKTANGVYTILPTYIGNEDDTMSEYPKITGATNGLSSTGTAYVYDGTFVGKNNYGIYTTGTLSIGTNDDTISTTLPLIQGDLYGLYKGAGTVNLYDGLYKGMTSGYFGVINGIADGYEIKDDMEVIDEDTTLQISYLNARPNFVEVDDQQFNSLNKAIKYIDDNLDGIGVMRITSNADINAGTTIPAGKNITLDLNGYTINVNKQIVNDGNFVIQDSSMDKNGVIIYNFTDAIVNNNIMTVKGGTFNGPSTFIYNNKHLTYEGGSLVVSGNSQYVYGIYNNKGNDVVFTMNDGSIDVTNISTSYQYISYGIYNYDWSVATEPTVIINGGEIKSTSTTPNSGLSAGIMYGNITINGGTIDANGSGKYVYNVAPVYLGNYSSLTINNNEEENKNPVIKSNNTCIYISTNNPVTINGGNYECEGVGLYVNYGNLILNNGNISSDNDGLYCRGTSCTITGGTIKSKNGKGVYANSGTLTINSSSMPESEYTYIEGYTNGVHVETNATLYIKESEIVGKTSNGVNSSVTTYIGENDDIINTEYPKVRGATNGLAVSGTTHLYDGVFIGIESGATGFISTFPESYSLKDEEIQIEGTNYIKSYLKPYDDFVKVGDVTFNSLQKAADYIVGTGKMELIASAEIKSSVTFPAGKNITLDFAGYTLNVSKQMVNNGRLTIEDSSGDNSGGIIYSITDVIVNTNIMTVKSGTFSGPSTFIANTKELNYDGGNLVVSSSVQNVFGIYNNGENTTFTMNGGTIDVTNNGSGGWYTGYGAYPIFNEISNNKTPIVTINDGYIKGTTSRSYAYSRAIQNGNVTINGGTLESVGSGDTIYMSQNSSLLINSNEDETKKPVIKASGACINISGSTSATIDGGIYECGGSGIYTTSSNSVIINNANITSNNVGVYVGYTGSTTIKGGKIISTGDNGVKLSNNTTLTINSDSMPEGEYTYIEGYTNGVFVENYGTVYIKESEIVGKTASGVYTNRPTYIGVDDDVSSEYPKITGATNGLTNAGTTYIYDGTIVGNTGHGISTTGTLTIGVKDQNVSISSPILIGELYGLYVSSGTTSLYDGILKGKTSGYTGGITNIEEGTFIFETTEIIKKLIESEELEEPEEIEEVYNVAYLKELYNIVTNVNKETSYKNLQTAIDDADSKDTLKLLDDISIFYDVALSPDDDITLDMDGYNISTSKTITNEGKLNIINDNNENKPYIAMSSANNLFVNKNKLAIDGVDIKYYVNNSSYYAFVNEANSDLNINNSNITSNYFGFNNKSGGTLTLEDTVVTSNNVSIKDYGKLDTNNLTITGSVYGIYSDTTINSVIKNTTVTNNNETSNSNYSIYKTNKLSKMELSDINVENGYLYNYSNMTITDGTIKDYIYNDLNQMDVTDTYITHNLDASFYNRGLLNIDGVTIDNTYTARSDYFGIKNYSILNIKNSSIIMNRTNSCNTSSGCDNEGIYSNTGTVTSTNNVYTLNTTTSTYMFLAGISNGGTSNLISTGDTINIESGNRSVGIYNTSTNTENMITSLTTNLNNAPIQDGVYTTNGGITLQNNNLNITNSKTTGYGINVNAGTLEMLSGDIVVNGPTAYGIYVNTGNATILNGNVKASGETAYGTYINALSGTLTAGTYDGTGLVTADVETDNPVIAGIGTNTGIGVNRVNGQFNYYDGKIVGTTNPMPESASLSEPNYEPVEYYDYVNRYRYIVLEYMKAEHNNIIATIDGNTYTSLQMAIDNAKDNDTIIIYKDFEEIVEIPSNKTLNIDFNNKTFTGEIVNYGTLNVYNGIVANLETAPIMNYGKLILGHDDDIMSIDDIIIIGTDIAIRNEGMFYIYDGYLRANTPLYGALTEMKEGYTYTITTEEGTNKLHLISGSVVVPLELEEDIVTDFTYTGGEQTFTAPQSGYYKLETWGAQGGSISNYHGGYGGYSIGIVYLEEGETLYINVGGQGKGATSQAQTLAGGYNGGGSVTGDRSVNHITGSGGGATHIALSSGILSDLSNNIDDILIVSGGGGGARDQSNHQSSARWGHGGHGGGYIAGVVESSYGTTSLTTVTLGSGSQTSGYAFGQGQNAYGQSAGGGGWHGGYNGFNDIDELNIGPGSGGSGYVGNMKLLSSTNITKGMYAYNAAQSSDYGIKTISTTSASDTATEYTAKQGDGHARITQLFDESSVPPSSKFIFKGFEEEFQVPKSGVYKLEVWGAQGGYGGSYRGGYGAYSTGEVYLNKGDTLYVNVGGQGTSSTAVATYKSIPGGYNGGGCAYQQDNRTLRAGGGGGATHISEKTGLLHELAEQQDSVLIVAGGGAGGYGFNTSWWDGNSGGGYIGGYSYNSEAPGKQNTGYRFGMGGDGTDLIVTSTNRAGGGGGWYGGFAYWGEQGAGGGSGYVGNEKLSNKAMYCYRCEESTAEDTFTVATENVSEEAIGNYAKIGDGYARITYIR